MENALKVEKLPHSTHLNIDHDSIPSQVFLNHFEAININIKRSKDYLNVSALPYFKKFTPFMNGNRLNQVKTMLMNAWNTEYALRSVTNTQDEQFLNLSLHWTFPQAYYSVFYSIRALMATQGVYTSNEEVLSKRVSTWVSRGLYPAIVGYYATGNFNEFKVHRLRETNIRPGLERLMNLEEAQAHIAQFLKTTRTMKAKEIRQTMQNNKETALRSKRTGEILEKFSKKDWEVVTNQMPVTTFLDLLGRLKLSANNREIERFLRASISFKSFHHALREIVNYLNFVHEVYLVKAVGLETYQQWMDELPAHLKNGFIKERFEDMMKTNLVLKQFKRNRQIAA